MSESNARWDWPEEEIKRVGYRVVDLIAEHLTHLPSRPVFQPCPSELAQRFLQAPPPAEGQTVEEVLTEFSRDVAPYPFGNGHPRFYGWVNSPPVIMGIFAEALAAALNPSCAGGNHAAVYVERQVLNWLKAIVGFPPDSMGLLVSGGSMAALTALAVARQAKCPFDVRAEGLRSGSSQLVFYKTAEGHGCHQKAVELLGIGSTGLRIVAHDDALRMRPSALDAAIRTDRDAGHTPIAVVATMGTVNTGAIDPLDDIADVCARHGVWLHVDGAYGAPAVLSRAYRDRRNALGRADSVALDPHKWLYVPVEAGAVLVKEGSQMRAAFSLVPPYLRTDGKPTGVGGLPWFSEYGFQQTRGFRALKVWMALKHHGLSGYSRAIEHDLALAGVLADDLRADANFEVWEPQGLSIVCFRYAPQEKRNDPAAIDALNQALLERVQLEGRVFLSSTVLNGRFWLRACVVNPRAAPEDMETLVRVIKAAGGSVGK